MNYLFYILIAINIISILLCVVDKINASRGGWRVRERDFFLLCILGGSVTMYITMRIIHHKTHHNRFMIGIPIIFALQIAAIAFLILK